LTSLVSLIPPLPDQPPLLRGTVTAVIMALGLQRESQYIAVATTDPTTGDRRQPNVLTNPTRNAEFLATQMQSAGYFQLADDQALVVTIDPGNAGYFVVPVTNDWTITDNYWDQQTSLNNSPMQARPNPDGTYTIVISPTDPKVWKLGFDRRPQPGHDLHSVPGSRPEVLGFADRQVAGGVVGQAGRRLTREDRLRHSTGSAGSDRGAKVGLQQAIRTVSPAIAGSHSTGRCQTASNRWKNSR